MSPHLTLVLLLACAGGAEPAPLPPPTIVTAELAPTPAPALPQWGDLGERSPMEDPAFSSLGATALKLGLGMTRADAMAVVEANPDLVYHADTANPERFYVDDAGGPAGDPALFYAQWPEGRPDMGRLVVYARAARLLAPGTDLLLSAPSYEAMDPAVKAWLGPEDRAVVTLDIPSIELKLTSHVFEQRGIEITDYSSQGDPPHIIVAFVKPALMAR